MRLEDIKYEERTLENPEDIPVILFKDLKEERTTLGDLTQGQDYHFYVRDKETKAIHGIGIYDQKGIKNFLRQGYAGDRDQIASSNIEVYLIKKKDSANTQ